MVLRKAAVVVVCHRLGPWRCLSAGSRGELRAATLLGMVCRESTREWKAKAALGISAFIFFPTPVPRDPSSVAKLVFSSGGYSTEAVPRACASIRAAGTGAAA